MAKTVTARMYTQVVMLECGACGDYTTNARTGGMDFHGSEAKAFTCESCGTRNRLPSKAEVA